MQQKCECVVGAKNVKSDDANQIFFDKRITQYRKPYHTYIYDVESWLTQNFFFFMFE